MGVFSLCRREEDADTGVIILFASANEVDAVLHLGAVANIQPPLQHGKKHYLPVVCNITFSTFPRVPVCA